MVPYFGLITLDLWRVVYQFQPSNGCPTEARYHRLYAAWFFNFNLQMVAQQGLDTTGFMPRGSSISTYKWLPNCGSIPPALCRVVLQFQPTNGCPTAARYHRLYAAWFFNFNLSFRMEISPKIMRLKLKYHTA